MNDNRRGALWITMLQAGLLGVVAGLCGYLLLTTVLQAPARAQGPGPGAGGVSGPAAVWPAAAFRAAANARSSRSSTRTATSVSTTRSAKLRASRLPPIPDLEAAASGVAAAREAVRTRRHDPGVPGAQGDARRRQVLSIGAALRPRHAAHDLPRVRERGLGAGARRLQQHRRRSARDGDRRRQDLQGRRRPLPRRVVVHDGARGVEAVA